MGSCFSKNDSQRKSLLHYDDDRKTVVKNCAEEVDTILMKCNFSSPAKTRRSFDMDIGRENVVGVACRRRDNNRPRSQDQEMRASQSPSMIPRANSMPGKMVSVHATEKNASDSAAETPVKRRGGSCSPVRVRELHQNRTVALSRRDSRKARQRGNPLAEMDSNAINLQKLNSSTVELDNHDTLARRRSSSPSIVNPKVPTNSSYTEFLLKDILNFHQSYPSHIATKAGNIKWENPGRLNYTKLDQFLESEVISEDENLTQPRFCKYVALGKDSSSQVGTDLECRESLDSNRLPLYQQHLMSTHCESISCQGKGLSREQKNRVGKGRIRNRNTVLNQSSFRFCE